MKIFADSISKVRIDHLEEDLFAFLEQSELVKCHDFVEALEHFFHKVGGQASHLESLQEDWQRARAAQSDPLSIFTKEVKKRGEYACQFCGGGGPQSLETCPKCGMVWFCKGKCWDAG